MIKETSGGFSQLEEATLYVPEMKVRCQVRCVLAYEGNRAVSNRVHVLPKRCRRKNRPNLDAEQRNDWPRPPVIVRRGQQ